MSLAALRPAVAADAAAIARLLEELGHPEGIHGIPTRLAALGRESRVIAYVAEVDGRVAGLATAHVIDALHSPTPLAMLTMLVVGAEYRGRGIGREMVEHAERWAVAQGAAKITLTSALHRAGAHQFYKGLGYEHTGVRLGRPLERSG